MTYTKRDFGRELNEKISLKNSVSQIGKWAHSVFFENCRELDYELKDIIEQLLMMEEEPEFEYTIQELQLLADKLINNEKDVLKQINEMRPQRPG
jgi:hypothetical protein